MSPSMTPLALTPVESSQQPFSDGVGAQRESNVLQESESPCQSQKRAGMFGVWGPGSRP